MQPDWKAEIVRLVQCKQLIHERDNQGALPWHLPAVAASADRIAAAEQGARSLFPASYRDFLAHANGWKGFYLLVDLFGTGDLIAGGSQRVLARPEVSAFVEAQGLNGQVTAIGASDHETDVFLLVAPSAATLPGGVIWWAGEEIDRFEDFFAFFTAMVAYNARIAEKLAG
jgi:hypothetical protein